MKKRDSLFCLLAGVASGFIFTCSSVSAADKVVVIPLGSAVGNAVTSDVVKGKTFSSRSGKGLTGSLKIREGSTIYTNSIGMEFSLLPAGSFVMGSPDGTGSTSYRPVWPVETGRNTDELQHVVTLTRSFYMQTTEVTQGQWEQVMGSGINPSYFSACGMDCPVEQVSWNEAQNFIDALNASEGRSNCNTTPNTCYSLPTESQWEYAARGGTLSSFYSGAITNTNCDPIDANLDKIGWYCGNAYSTTHPVAQKEANNWSLYDMSGNVFEWCEDWVGTYPDGPVDDPTGVTTGTFRVMRGGSFQFFAWLARSADRIGRVQDQRFKYLGFRLILPLGQ